MALYELTHDRICAVPQTSFAKAKVFERGDLQRLLREQIEIVLPDGLVIAEEFGEWEDSRRRIDLLAIDKHANLVVVELKRTEDGGHMDLQAIRYAAMVSTMTFEQVTAAYARYLDKRGVVEDAQESLLAFLEWDEPRAGEFNQDVRIVLVSAEFPLELTSAVLWLNRRGIDVRCIRLLPYDLEGRLLLDVQQILPTPEEAEYQVRLREKEEEERAAKKGQWDKQKILQAIETNCGRQAAELARELHDWSSPLVTYIWFGEGSITGTFKPTVLINGAKYHLFVVRTDGKIVIRLLNFRDKGIFRDQQYLLELVERFNKIPGISFSPDDINGKPKFSIELLDYPSSMEQFKETILWLIEKAKAGYHQQDA